MQPSPRHVRPHRWCATAGLLALVACGESSGGGVEREAPGTPVAAPDLTRQRPTSAAVEPRAMIRLASRASGTVEAVRVDVGDAVREGQVLALLDTSEQRAQLARARAQQEQAQTEYVRATEMRASGLISLAEYELVRTAVRVAESERDLWRARVAFGRVTAPRDAVITARRIHPGEAVDAQAVLFELVATDELVVRLGVSELDVVHLEEGQPVPVLVDALAHLEPLEGTIRRIFPAAEPGSRLITVEVALAPDAWARGVRPGFLARVRVAVDERPKAIAVPAAAIGDDGEERYVFVIEDGRLRRRAIEIGVTRGDWTEVVAGLRAGEVVLATNPVEMREGQSVRIVGWRG